MMLSMATRLHLIDQLQRDAAVAGLASREEHARPRRPPPRLRRSWREHIDEVARARRPFSLDADLVISSSSFELPLSSLARSGSSDAASSSTLGYASSSLSAVAAASGVQAATMAGGTRISGALSRRASISLMAAGSLESTSESRGRPAALVHGHFRVLLDVDVVPLVPEVREHVHAILPVSLRCLAGQAPSAQNPPTIGPLPVLAALDAIVRILDAPG